MPGGPDLGVEDIAKALNRCERDIRGLARAAKNGSNWVEWPVLRDRTTGEPITDKDGWAYAVIAAPPPRRGRPARLRGENSWCFRQVKPPQGRVTLAKRFLLPGSPLGRGHKIIEAVAAAADIVPGAPVRALGDARPGEPVKVIAAEGPGPVLGILLLPEGRPVGWLTRKDNRLEVLVRGTVQLPAAGPIGMGPGFDRLLWDPHARCWREEPVEGHSLLELLGSWGIEHSSDGGEPVAVWVDSDQGLALERAC